MQFVLGAMVFASGILVGAAIVHSSINRVNATKDN